jgi:hypothetical protein
MSTDHSSKPDVTEIVQIGNHLVDLSSVSPELRSAYHRAAHALPDIRARKSRWPAFASRYSTSKASLRSKPASRSAAITKS